METTKNNVSKGSGTLLTMLYKETVRYKVVDSYSTCLKYDLLIGTLLWKVSHILVKSLPNRTQCFQCLPNIEDRGQSWWSLTSSH